MTHVNVFLHLSKYEQLQFIGEGGFGEVYEVKDKDSGEIYAAKVSKNQVNQDFINDESTFLIFREVNLLTALNHPSILKFIGYSSKDFENDENPTIIIEYAPSGSLKDVLESVSNSIPPDLWDDTNKLINIYGIASGMEYLHAHDVLHRDLKPDNILMNEKLHPKISDFGLSKSQNFCKDFDIEEVSTGKYKGTLLYMPPEANSNGEFTKAGDVYSFGLIVYQIMEGKSKIFDEIGYKSVIDMAFYGKRPEISKNVPDSYKNLIKKCWDQDPKKRPTFTEIVNDLRKYEYITEKVNEEAFYEYVEYIEDNTTSFDLSSRSIQFNEFIQGRKKMRMRSNAVRGPPPIFLKDIQIAASQDNFLNMKRKSGITNSFSKELAQIEIDNSQDEEEKNERKYRKRNCNVFQPPQKFLEE